MTIKFRDILQCADGPLKGMLAQVIEVTMVDVELLSRDKDGTPHAFRVSESDISAWRHTGGVAISGPKRQTISEPGAAPELVGVSGQIVATEVITGASDAAPVRPPRSPLVSLNVDELMAPMPDTVKVLPINQEEPVAIDTTVPATPTWNMDDPPPTEKQARQNKRYINQQRIESNPLPKLKYSATVANANGDQTRVEYSLRKGVDPARFAGIPIRLSKKWIADVAPFKVLNYTPLP